MALFVPILRMFMLFLNVWDTFKTLKPPPTKTRNGKVEPPSVRSVTQRKRDLKGCLAIWIVWCCFTVYERHVEPIISLFIPFYNEFKALVILFMIFTRARGAEPIFLHIIRPVLRPYAKSIDGSLELFRLVGDLLFAIISFPLKALSAFLPSYFGTGHANDIPPPYSETPTAADLHTPPPDAQHSNGSSDQRSSIFHPGDAVADMEWRRYPSLPSAYPPTPLVTSSRLPNQIQHPLPGHVGYDPSSAAQLHAIWVPPVAEEDEDEDEDEPQSRQDFHRSLLPPREPLHPGFGYHGGLSDDSDRGDEIEKQTQLLDDLQSRRDTSASGYSSSSIGEVGAMDVDIHDVEDEGRDEDYQLNSDDDGEDSDEDSFNITLQTPRVPLSLKPNSASASRSTIRTRASARSIFADLEREKEGRRQSGSTLQPLPDTTSHDSSPSSVDSESLSISSDEDGMSMLISKHGSGSGSGATPATAQHLLRDFAEHDPASDSSLGSADPSHPGPSRQGRKRSHSRSFPPEQVQKGKGTKTPLNSGVGLRRLSSVESTSSSSSLAQPLSDASDVPDAPRTSDLEDVEATVRKTVPLGKREGRARTSIVEDDLNSEAEVRAEEVPLIGTRKRRKVISSSSASGQGTTSTTSESEAVNTGSRASSRGKAASSSSANKASPQPRARATPSRRQAPSAVGLGTDTDGPRRPRKPVLSTAISATKGKGKAVETLSRARPASSVPTRKQFDVVHKMKGAGHAAGEQGSTASRLTRSAAAARVPSTSALGAGAESSSDIPSESGESGPGADARSLQSGRARVQTQKRA